MTRIAVLLVCVVPALTHAAAGPASLLDWAKAYQGRYAYGLYFKGKKVGWQVEELKVGKYRGRDVVFTTNEERMETLFDGEKSVKAEKSTTCYDLTGDGEILYAEVDRKEDGKALRRRVDRVGKELRVVTEQGGRTLTRTVPMSKDTFALHRQLTGWLAGDRTKGDRFVGYSASWEDEDIDNKHVYVFQERKPLVLGGLAAVGSAVEVDMDGSKMDAVMVRDARIVTAELGKLLTIKLEPEAAARKMDGPLVDIMPVTSIFVDKPLGQARNVDALTLEVKGLGDFKIPASHRQKVTAEKGRTVLELRRDFCVEMGQALSAKEVKEYTKATPRIQCDNEQVANLAKKVVGDETDPLKKARKLERYVYKTLKKSYSDNADTALEILDRMAGDCTEHSLLFVALARAAGVPAREVGGLAYVPDVKPMFGWHAWAEVHDGHQWVSVDPTWGQVYVDGTHLKLSTGEKDLGWTNVIGTLEMKVLEVKKREE